MERFLTPTGAVSFLAGAIIIVATVTSIVRSMLIPLPRVTLVSRGSRNAVQAIAWFVAGRFRTYARQDAVLSAVGPVSVLIELLLIITMFLFGFAFMIYGVSPVDLSEALLQSGSTLLTLGIVGRDNAAQVVVNFLAALAGVAIVAILIGYLFSLYSAYTSRESRVSRSSVRAGEPAWGPEILCRRQLSGKPPLSSDSGWSEWVSDMRSSQTMYPVLNHFRSYTPNRSWVTTLLAMLDATALQATVCETQGVEPDTEFLVTGAQTFTVLLRNHNQHRISFRRELLPVARTPAAALTAGEAAVFRAVVADDRRSAEATGTSSPTEVAHCSLTREEFDFALGLMERCGVPLREDREAAWVAFRQIRATYEACATSLARTLHAVPAPWSGSRRLGITTMWPTLAADELSHGEGGQPRR